MSLITAYDDKVEITGLTKNNVYHTADLSTYVQTDCLGVLVQFVNTSGSNLNCGYRTTGSATAKSFVVYANSHEILLLKLNGSYQVDLKFQNSNIDVFIMSEFFEGTVLRDTDNWLEYQPGGGNWFTITVSPLGTDAYADIEAVLVYGKKTSGTQTFGARALGSTVETAFLVQSQIFVLPVQTNSNGQYQIYIPSGGCAEPTVWGVEVGYIKKDYGFSAVFEPADLSPDTNADWEDLDLSSVVETNTTQAVLRLLINKSSATGVRDTCGIRSKSSSNAADSLRNAIWVTYWVNVNSNKLVEYRYQGTQPVIFDVWGYIVTEPPPEPEIPPEPEVTPPALVTVLDRYTTSVGPVLMEILNLADVRDGDFAITQIQHPLFGFGVINSSGSVVTEAINLDISNRVITINNKDLDGDDDLILLIFGY